MLKKKKKDLGLPENLWNQGEPNVIFCMSD